MKKIRNPMAKGTRDAEKKSHPQDADKPVQEHCYRCPACGALVDGRDHEEMALHHRHVLFPQQFDLRKKPGSK